MSNKRQRNQYDQLTTLAKNGWNVTSASRYNSGSETVRHSICKQLAGHYLKHELDYNVGFECTHEDRGEIDVIAWGLEDRLSPIAVECETSPTEETIQDKLERYVHGTPLQEMYVLNVNEMPADILEAYNWVSQEI